MSTWKPKSNSLFVDRILVIKADPEVLQGTFGCDWFMVNLCSLLFWIMGPAVNNGWAWGTITIYLNWYQVLTWQDPVKASCCNAFTGKAWELHIWRKLFWSSNSLTQHEFKRCRVQQAIKLSVKAVTQWQHQGFSQALQSYLILLMKQ